VDITIAYSFISFAVLLFALTVHEAAHAWAADRLGDPTGRRAGRLSLNPLAHADLVGTLLLPLVAIVRGVPVIGWAKPVPVDARRLRRPRRDALLVAAAGPVSHLAIALAAASALAILPVSPQTLGEPNLSVPVAAFLTRAMRLNVLLALFHLLPIPPLDGGTMLAALLPASVAASFDRLRPYGFVLLGVLVLVGGFDAIAVPPNRLILSWLSK
jgi:Zn-dependent protease